MNELIKTCISKTKSHNRRPIMALAKTHNCVLQFKQENSPSIPTHPQPRPQKTLIIVNC